MEKGEWVSQIKKRGREEGKGRWDPENEMILKFT